MCRFSGMQGWIVQIVRCLVTTALCGAFVLCVPQMEDAVAFGPPNYLPDKPHPRIFLTQENLTVLRANASANTAEWVALRNWCSTHINDTGWQNTKDTRWQAGYRMGAFGKHISNFALAYQVLKVSNPDLAAVYGHHALDIMNATLANFSAGEELDGLVMIRQGELYDATINAAESVAAKVKYPNISLASYKNGYSSRSICVAMVLGYDWIYDLMSAEEKKKFAGVFARWIDWSRGVRSLYNNGVLLNGIRYYEDASGPADATHVNTTASGKAIKAYGIDAPPNNFFSGHFLMTMLASVAIYGDIPDSFTYLDFARNVLWETSLKPDVTSVVGSKGGDSTEGWNYAGGWFRDIEALYAYKYATGEDLFAGLEWPKELVNCYIQATNSNLATVLNYGEITGNSGKAQPYQDIILSPTYVTRKEYPYEDVHLFGQYYLNHAKFATFSEDWKRFVFTTPAAQEKPLTSMPLFYHSVGSGLVTTRTSWLDAPDTLFASVQLGGMVTPGVSHETYDEGNIFLQRGADVLLTHQNLVRSSVSHNTVVFNATDHHASNPALKSPAIDRFEHGQGYTFVRGDITNAWKREYKPDRCKLFMRNLLHVLPNHIVVYDVTRSNSTVGNLKEWVTNYIAEPVIDQSNNSISATIGASKIFIKTLFPSGGVFTKEAPSAGYWRAKFTPTTAQEYEQFLHVIEATGSEFKQTSVIAISSNNMRGAHITSAGQDAVAMFPVDQTGMDASGNVSYVYAPTSTTTNHYLANLPPGQTYSVSVSGSTTKTVTLSPGTSSIRVSDNGLLVLAVNRDNTFVQVNRPEVTSGANTVVPAKSLRRRSQ